MTLTSGTKVGPYEIQAPLGAGGMGEVYRARDSRLGRDVAGKGMIYPIAGGDARPVPGWLADDLWITWLADGHSAFVYQDDKTSAPVYRLDLTTGKRDLVMTLAPSDSGGVTSIVSVRMTADGKTYGYSYTRELSDLFLVSGVH